LSKRREYLEAEGEAGDEYKKGALLITNGALRGYVEQGHLPTKSRVNETEMEEERGNGAREVGGFPRKLGGVGTDFS